MGWDRGVLRLESHQSKRLIAPASTGHPATTADTVLTGLLANAQQTEAPLHIVDFGAGASGAVTRVARPAAQLLSAGAAQALLLALHVHAVLDAADVPLLVLLRRRRQVPVLALRDAKVLVKLVL
jgi:hypothetical protein